MKGVKGYEDYYSVTKDGRVWSKRRKKWLKPIKQSFGYRVVWLSIKSLIHKKKKIHRLVAEVYLPNPYNLPEVNHKNLDKSDNRVKNLKWISHVENSKHGYKTKKKILSKCKTEGERKKIILFFKRNSNNRIYPSQIYSNNIEKNRKKAREKYAKNHEYLRAYNKIRYQENIEYYRKYNREYYKKTRKTL